MLTRFWSSYAERPSHWFWTRAANNAAVSASSLGVYRWIFCLYLLIFDLPSWAWLEHVPRALFDPPPLSPASLVSGFPPYPFFSVLDAVLIACLCLVTVGYRTRLFTLVYLGLVLVGCNFNFCFGKIDHSSVLSSVLLGCMAYAGWGKHYSVDALRSPHRTEPSTAADPRVRRGLALFAVVLAFGMLTAGLPKAWSWVDFNLQTSGFLAWYYPNRYSLGREYMLAPLVPLSPPLVLELADYAGSLFETLGFAALLINRKTWRLWLAVAALFHLANALVLNIAFTQQALVYVVFASCAGLLPELSPVQLRTWLQVLVPAVVVIGGVRLWLRVQGLTTYAFFATNAHADDIATLILAVPYCALAATLLVRHVLKERAVPA